MGLSDELGALAVGAGNLLAWIAHSEQIWFPIAGTYMRYISPMYNLPDLRGPFAFLALLYIGLRLGDLLDKRDELNS